MSIKKEENSADKTDSKALAKQPRATINYIRVFGLSAVIAALGAIHLSSLFPQPSYDYVSYAGDYSWDCHDGMDGMYDMDDAYFVGPRMEPQVNVLHATESI